MIISIMNTMELTMEDEKRKINLLNFLLILAQKLLSNWIDEDEDVSLVSFLPSKFSRTSEGNEIMR